MELALIKTSYGVFPYDDETGEAFAKLTIGTVIRAAFRKVRNPLFHRKFMALVKLGFDLWESHSEPVAVPTGSVGKEPGEVIPERNFNEFRYWLTIKAGFYVVVAYPDGAVRARAKSIKFAKMDQDEFEALFSKVVDVILLEVLKGGYDRQRLEQDVERIMLFT